MTARFLDKYKAKQSCFVENVIFSGGGGKFGLFIINSSLLNGINKIQLCWCKMGGQIFSHKKGNSRERNWLELETSGKLGSLLLGRREGNLHGMAFPRNSFPFINWSQFLPCVFTHSFQQQWDRQPPSTVFCLTWLFPCTQDLCLSIAICNPSGPSDSSHLARRKLSILDQTRWRS